MNYISRVKITGFWGDKEVNIKLGNKENFLIGVNGSGKTTIINLIAATLEANFPTLDSTQFSSITIFLTSSEKNQPKSRIVVKKEENDITPYQNIHYLIYKGTELDFDIYLDDLAEERIFRYSDLESERLIRMRNQKIHKKDLSVILEDLFKTSWLTIHRTNFKSTKRDDRNQSLVDLKLYEFERNFTGYLNELNRSAKNETDQFQKFIFLSLLKTESQNQLRQTLDKIKIEKEKEDLAKVYSLFNLDESDYSDNLKDYTESFKEALVKFKDKDQTINFFEAEYLIGMKRIHSVIQEWKELISKQNKIFKDRDNFIEIVNNLLQRKELKINERNELEVKTQSDKTFDLRFLSSGEKQLLIIFGETLLQKSTPHIFIADEPELSLHVEWQEQLVGSLKLLNPYAQLIFATHSPDIVSSFQKSVIKIEKCIN